jgi:preprotein translocase subunit SecA
VFKRLFGGLIDSNEKEINRLEIIVNQINDLEPEFVKLSLEELKSKTADLKTQIADATSSSKEAVEIARRELIEKRKCESEAVNSIMQEELSKECRDLEGQLKSRQDELRSTEKTILDKLLPQAFAAVREAAKRTIHQRHFDVQLMGGIVLHQGKIAEMRTGEGKTLVATCPLYLNSLAGRGSHLITVNDYLARRDPYWMGPIYHALGITVACIYPQQTPDEHLPARIFDPDFDSGDVFWKHYRPITRKQAYEADITYGTSAEFGFDYLRDNMVIDLSQCSQRELNFGIVDEVDNLLIDEARTPLIISGPAEDTGALYKAVDLAVRKMSYKLFPHEPISYQEKEEKERLREDIDFFAYEKEHAVEETHRGQEKLARAFNMKAEDLFGGESEEEQPLTFEQSKLRNDIRSVFRNSMVAQALYKNDRDYVIQENTETKKPEVIIVDTFTGRLMLGRRYSEGLHQAIEAKESVPIQRESKTYGTITIQNYFRMYPKLAGMTGTAVTEAEEFHKIYKLDVVVIPTNKPTIRKDFNDQIYRDKEAKFNAVAREIEEVHKKGQPILVGTVSIEKSEFLRDILKRKGVPFQILNAKEHEKEATVIAEAGKPGAVTVATNMAGRGVDIVLGGKEPEKPVDTNPDVIKDWEKTRQEWEERHNQVLSMGGLHVIGTERHEARRIDNQLRGRSGRQGDPGSSRFYLALDDDIVKRFGGDRIKSIMSWIGMDAETPIENSMVSKTIEGSQVKVEGYHFDIRKHLVEYDDVVNKHRELMYAERRKILSGADLKTNILNMVEQEIRNIVAERIGSKTNDEWDMTGLIADLNTIIPSKTFPPSEDITPDLLAQLNPRTIEKILIEYARNSYDQKEKETGPQDMRLLERLVMLKIMDSLWIEHLTAMENMRQEANWQTLRQVKAVDAYKSQGYQQFQLLMDTIRQDVARTIFHVNIRREDDRKISTPLTKVAQNANKPVKVIPRVAGKKVGRNDPCPCGSGKKFKHCCGE